MYAVEDPDTKALLVGPDKSNLGAKGVAHRFIRARFSTSLQLEDQ